MSNMFQRNRLRQGEPTAPIINSVRPTAPPAQEPVDLLGSWEPPVDATPSSTPRRQRPKAVVSDSTPPSSALQASYERGTHSADTATSEIDNDKAEVVHIIANYAVEPLEMLHLVDRWLQQLLSEFHRQRDTFKYQLRPKWLNDELPNIQSDNNDRIRRIHSASKQLQEAHDTLLSRQAFNEMDAFFRNVDEFSAENLKERFDSIAQDYTNILRILELLDRELRRDTGRSDDHLADVHRSLTKLRQLNNKASHTICILGLEKAGKSTFINALLGFELLPAAIERCTQVRTVLKPPMEGDDQDLYATVKFYNDDEFEVFYEKMPQKTDETDQQFDVRKKLVRDAREGVRRRFPEEQFRVTNSTNQQRQRDDIHQKLHAYITGEVFVNTVKEIAIYTDRLPGKNYELLDVPGFDSPIKEHRDAGLEAIRTADAFLFLTSGQQPSLTQPQVQLLTEIQHNHFEAMQRAFGIITKLDLCQTSTTFQEHYSRSYDELIEKGFKPERIFVTCSRLQLLQPDSEEYRVIDAKARNFGCGLGDGFARSKEALNRFIEHELPKTHLKQLMDLGRMRLARPVGERLKEVQERQLLRQNIVSMSIDDYLKEQKEQSWDGVFDKNIFAPAFANANTWHTHTVTRDRAQFVQNAKEKFHEAFLHRTQSFLKAKHPIEQSMFETFGYSKLQLNVHPTDNAVREQLSMELEKIVDVTSDVLADHFYHTYICGFEDILNQVCPHLKDLYRPTLTRDKCVNETHALILRVSRPIIMSVLRYSHLDLPVKHDAIKELVYIAPMVATNIVRHQEQNPNSNASLTAEIRKVVEQMNGQNDMTTPMIKILFK